MTKQQAIVGLQKAIEKDYCRIELPYNLVVGVIELLAKAPEWVRVKDRMPDNEDETYLGIVSGTVIEGCAIVNLDKSMEFVNWESGIGFYMPDYPDDKISVSHWMEIPKPPEDKTKKRYVCMAEITVPMCDDDGHTIDGRQCVVETGSMWEVKRTNIIGGEIHLEEVGKPWHWLEIPKELFDACFQED